MTGEEFAIHVSRPQVRILGLLLVVLAIGLAAGFRASFGLREIILMVGAILSGVATVSFARQVMIDAGTEPARSLLRASRGAALFLPLLLAFYLTLFEGAWKVLALFSAFSVSSLLARIAFLYIGWRLATALMHLSEIPKQVAGGHVIVLDPPIKAPAT